MKKEEINEFMNMTLQEKKDKIIEIISDFFIMRITNESTLNG